MLDENPVHACPRCAYTPRATYPGTRALLLRSHLALKHGISRLLDLCVRGLGCPYCPSVFATIQAVKKHVQAHHSSALAVLPGDPIRP